MAQKPMIYLVLVLLLGFGFLAGSFTGGFVAQLTVPAGHKSIIGSMTIRDTQANVLLSPKLVESSNVEWGKGLSVYFVKGKVYPQSTWLWQRYGDTEIVMNIWGPDESGTMYGVEIARLAWSPFEVKIDGVTKLTIDPVTSLEPAIGYYQLEVRLP